MPRRHRRETAPTGIDQERARRGIERVQLSPDGAWAVRHVSGGGAVKTYRCPGCDQEIPPRTAHIVAWPADERGDLSDRRHWHTGCWQARERRGPTRRR